MTDLSPGGISRKHPTSFSLPGAAGEDAPPLVHFRRVLTELLSQGIQPKILLPFHRDEACTVSEATKIANRSPRRLREWAQTCGIGRYVAGRWAISRIALDILLSGDVESMRKYLLGDRRSEAIVAYYERCGVPLPRTRAQGVAA